MRQVYLVFLTGLIIVASLLVANWRYFLTNHKVQGPAIYLKNTPATYCPKEVNIYQPAKAKFKITPVTNCSVVALDSLGLTDGEKVYIKTDKSLTFTIDYQGGVDQYWVALRVGDVNNDNIIDKTDEDRIEREIFSSLVSADIDKSGQVTADDLAIARINRGIGEALPDNKEWPE